MNITKENIDNLNAVVTIELKPADYEKRVDDAIKKVQKQASMPGFRPGKVPTGMVKKMYGKSVLADELNKILNENLQNYIVENKLDILGNPLPKEDHKIDWEAGKDFTFKYELGLAPDFKVDAGGHNAFVYEVVKVDDALVDKYVKDVRRNYGKPSNPETAEEKDVLFVDINELDETGAIKAGGVFKSTSIGIERLKNEAAKKKLIGAKKDDKIVISSKELYETALDASIALGIDKEAAESFSADLQLTVKNIARMEDADMNEEFFKKIYNDESVKTEHDFREKVRGELGMMFAQDSDKKLFQTIENGLIDNINPALPEDFLKRWLMAVNDKPVTMEQLNSEFGAWARQMKWKLIENKLIKDNDIKVTADEAKEEAARFVKSHYARYGQTPDEAEVEKAVKTILSKDKEAEKVYENLYHTKLMQFFKDKFKLEKKEVTYNEFFGIKE